MIYSGVERELTENGMNNQNRADQNKNI